MKTLIKVLTIVSLLLSVNAYAHVSLKTSMPADQAILSQAPQSLSLTFSKNVKIVKLTLKNQQGEKIKFGFKPTKQASNQFSWQLPKLTPANYTIAMTFLGKDGHKMKDSISFTVK